MLGRHMGSGLSLSSSTAASLLRVQRDALGLFAYVISPEGSRRLLHALFPLRYQLDTELCLRLRHLRVLRPKGALAHSDGSAPGNTDVQRVHGYVANSSDALNRTLRR